MMLEFKFLLLPRTQWF